MKNCIIIKDEKGYMIKYSYGKLGDKTRYEYLCAGNKINAPIKIYKSLKGAENW